MSTISKEFALQTFGIILQEELALYICGEYFLSSVERNKIGLYSNLRVTHSGHNLRYIIFVGIIYKP
jgi:hypothetical protein